MCTKNASETSKRANQWVNTPVTSTHTHTQRVCVILRVERLREKKEKDALVFVCESERAREKKRPHRHVVVLKTIKNFLVKKNGENYVKKRNMS